MQSLAARRLSQLKNIRWSRQDVEAIAREISDELGPGADVNAVAVAGDASLPAAQSSLSARSDAKLWHMYFEQIDERIDRLERTVAAAVDLLHRLLHPDKSGNEPGTGTRR